jgi:hypothetical protein
MNEKIVKSTAGSAAGGATVSGVGLRLATQEFFENEKAEALRFAKKRKAAGKEQALCAAIASGFAKDNVAPSKKTAYKCAESILDHVNTHLESSGFEKVSVTTVYRRICATLEE